MATNSGGRLLIPFFMWSMFYSCLTLVQKIHSGEEICWIGFIYRFAVGKVATPFYYIVVLFQLTLMTRWLVCVVKRGGRVKKLLWAITPAYLLYVYLWNFIVGSSPFLYETFFPAWFGFYYLGIQVRCGNRFQCSGIGVGVAFLFSCIEALLLRQVGMSIGFCISQITAGSFLYSTAFIGWLLRKTGSEKKNKSSSSIVEVLSNVGDCSYGIFYIHMFVIMIVGRIISHVGFADNWWFYWISRFCITAAVSYLIVRAAQVTIDKNSKVLKWIGFV